MKIQSVLFLGILSLSYNLTRGQGIPQRQLAPNPQQQTPISTVGFPNGALLNSDGHRIFLGKNKLDASKSAFLYTEWLPGTVKLENQTQYTDLKILYDQLNDRLLFCTEETQPQEFLEKVQEFSLPMIKELGIPKRIFRNGYPAYNNFTASSYYEVLVDRKTKLLKKTVKSIVEEAPPGSIIRSKHIKEVSTQYFLVTNNKLIRIKKDKNFVLSSLKDSTSQIENYVNNNHPDLKKEDDIIKLIIYYNTL
ncbi:MAG: hypothetical protein H7Y13_00665 [Sphingobacteriaceae bacterium]|nr:hypothetical protein [Sphingobacteriaceae bacterium]